ncbi:hypothetical protein PGT21_028981 [Puccinia graminis f. sp. tritici]|uniref:Uncharacterized protein n=1 Tax=Puccinia graminis f. sp. tritici TaxID=56615 RepID=A0A5B0R8C0_PUCGR|nr:hypothetical protein PGT21_028981 [Puccinia graminis f. sp. tritici]KAA1121569.1 hypothetical protein PGTUg99_032434 [Puccinia graminis f. sp. tritici]
MGGIKWTSSLESLTGPPRLGMPEETAQDQTSQWTSTAKSDWTFTKRKINSKFPSIWQSDQSSSDPREPTSIEQHNTTGSHALISECWVRENDGEEQRYRNPARYIFSCHSSL